MEIVLCSLCFRSKPDDCGVNISKFVIKNINVTQMKNAASELAEICVIKSFAVF